MLLETYAKSGMMAAERLIREEFAAYMYAGGQGRVINRAEYLRWKFRDQEQVIRKKNEFVIKFKFYLLNRGLPFSQLSGGVANRSFTVST